MVTSCTGRNDFCVANENITKWHSAIADHTCQGGLGETCYSQVYSREWVLEKVASGSYHFPLCENCILALGLKW